MTAQRRAKASVKPAGARAAAPDLEALARAAQARAYAPYSKFHVGCALVTRDGAVFTGANVENASYGLTVCAERNAVMAMVLAGATDIRAIYVASDIAPPASPCGMCRQTLLEFARDPATTRVVAVSPTDGPDGRDDWTLAELIPHGFTGDQLDRPRPAAPPPLEEIRERYVRDRIDDQIQYHQARAAQDVHAPVLHRRHRRQARPLGHAGTHLLVGQRRSLTQLDDDLGRARQDELGRGLYGFPRHVGEDVVAAGHDEHVVQETATAGDVDVAQGARLAAEDQQRPHAPRSGRACAHRRQPLLDALGDALRLGHVSGHPSQVAQRREHVGQAGVAVVVGPNGGSLQLPP